MSGRADRTPTGYLRWRLYWPFWICGAAAGGLSMADFLAAPTCRWLGLAAAAFSLAALPACLALTRSDPSNRGDDDD